MFGSNCDQECTCDVNNGVCYTGPKGNGTCLACLSDFIGLNCTIPCSCINGECDKGPTGSGKCIGPNCEGNWFGELCDQNGKFCLFFILMLTF